MDIHNDDHVAALLVAEDPLSQTLLATARKAANSNASVLISGETGVGKELIARYIHQHSLVNQGPYISVNCAALPDNMIESILFGYEKGAYTGAVTSYAGKFEQAQNGTLLLDEISELPLALQAKLLRALQEHEIERLGGKKLIRVNSRIIAATNQDLKNQVKAGQFRSDLYYRLNVVPIHCLPLRSRILDIIPLANFFIRKYTTMLGKDIVTLSINAQKKLLSYPWPGNVRELENIIHRAIIMLNGDVLQETDLTLNDEEKNSYLGSMQFDTKLKEQEAQVILDVLYEAEGKRDIAARKLNISPRTLRYKLSKLKSNGIKVPNKIL